MSEEQEFILDVKVDGLADKVNSFFNKYKSELVMKGYTLKKEWNLKESVGGKIIGRQKVDYGGGIEIEKKVGKKYKVKLEFRAVDEDIRITSWSSKAKDEVSPVISEELQKLVEKVKGKIG
ncbi:MAG: hypothetical protein ACTSRG_26185 [Candidatus Helarchaeota archaeon]